LWGWSSCKNGGGFLSGILSSWGLFFLNFRLNFSSSFSWGFLSCISGNFSWWCWVGIDGGGTSEECCDNNLLGVLSSRLIQEA